MSVFFATPSHKCNDEQLGEIANWSASVVGKLKLDKAQLSVVRNCPWLDSARADLVAAFMRTDLPYLFFRDDDNFIKADVLRRMIELNQPIVIAPYKMRLPPYNWTVRRGGALNHVVAAGLGVALIQRHVIRGMIDAYPELHYRQDGEPRWALFHHEIKNGELLKEDHAFFMRAGECGFGIHCLDNVTVDHGGVVSTWHNEP
jgi:hypothetical protein